jgi:hypothetical protein
MADAPVITLRTQDVIAYLLASLREPGGRYLMSIGLTHEEIAAQEAPTYGGKSTSRWLTDEEYAELCVLLASAENAADSPCREADGCPTEGAVLQRYWREQHAVIKAIETPDAKDDTPG